MICTQCNYEPIWDLKGGLCEICLVTNNDDMKVIKKISVQGEFAKVGEDIKDGDIIVIQDGGTEIVSQHGPQVVYSIKTRNGSKNLGINQTSVNALIDAYGDETENWVGKNATANLLKQMISGSLKNVVYLAPEGYIFSNEGKIVKEGSTTETAEKTINYDEGEVAPSDIPF